MIKKTITTMCIYALMSQSYAGEMGAVSSLSSYKLTPFISGEGSVTWDSIKSVTLFGQAPQQTRQRWGGRGAVGILFPYLEHLQFSSEMGWGYYGHVKMSNSAISSQGIRLNISNSDQLSGFDLLAGALYNYNQVDLFFKAGAMIENRAYDAHRTLSLPANTSVFNLNNTQTNVYPEIKIGAIYNINQWLGVLLAYMYVFGNEGLKATVPDGRAPATNTYVTTDLAAPALQSVMFGLVYKFV